MYHGMNPSNGDGFLEQQLQQQQPQSPQRLLAVILWFQLALCFGPAQLTGGEWTPLCWGSIGQLSGERSLC